MVKQHWKPLNLPAELVDDLKLWRRAFIATYRREMTYAEIIAGMLTSLESSDPAVFEEHEKLLNELDKNNSI